MRVAVTGASGFVGGRAVRWLRARGHEVFPYGRRPADALRAPIAGYVAWDLIDGPRALPPVDVVVHCGAQVGDTVEDPRYESVNVAGTRAVLASFPAPARVVLISSASVYDLRAPTSRITEADGRTGRPLNAYSRTKLGAEQVVAASGRSSVILRPRFVYGPGDTHLLPGVLAARRFGRVPAYGDGTNRMSVTHVDNLALAIECALAPGAPPGTYNVADGEVATLDEILRTLLARIGVAPRVAYIPRAIAWPVAVLADALPAGLRGSGDRRLSRYLVRQMSDEFTMDIGLARERLGYAPRWTFRDGPLTDETG